MATDIRIVLLSGRAVEAYYGTADGWSGQPAGPGEAISLDSIACRLDVDLPYDPAGA